MAATSTGDHRLARASFAPLRSPWPGNINHASLTFDLEPPLGAGHPKNADADDPNHPKLIRWSIQEIRRIAIRLERARIMPAHIIAWSLWRRAHQEVARRCHVNAKWQL
jgi:hypothetical protein